MTTDNQCPFCHGVHYSSYNAERCHARHEAREQVRAFAKARSASRNLRVPGGGVFGQIQEARPQIQSVDLPSSASQHNPYLL